MAVALVGALSSSHQPPSHWIWIGLCGVVESVFVLAWLRREDDTRTDPSPTNRNLIASVVVALGAFSALPWLWAQDLLAMQLLVAPAVLAAAAMLSTLTWLSWSPLVVPLIWLIGGVVDPTQASPTPPWLPVVAGALAVLVVVVRAAIRGSHRKAARETIAFRQRIRELALARDAAKRADRDKSRFLAIASHDLRQPLHALGLFAATLETRLQATPDKPVVVEMVQAIDGLNRSFNALMDVSQLEAGAIRPNIQRFPLRDIFRRLHMHFAGQAELAGLALRFSTGGKSVSSDPQLLERLLGNLIQNALKYTVRGGVVVVARTTRTQFHVEVWDTGLGISDVELPRVFQEFYQVDRRDGLRAKGLGMGLAIVKRLARLLGHDLTVVSCLGRGSMFRLSIQRGSLAEIEDATAAADTLPMPLIGQRTALIVDDDASILSGLELLLAEWGYRSIAATTQAEACYALRVNESTPDLILCDLHLGEGPDGIAVIRAIRRQCGRELPAILITGDPTGDEIARTVGSDLLVLSKPVQPRTLRNALRSLEEKNT